MWVRPKRLPGERLFLEPLQASHAEPLRAIADADCFRYFLLAPASMEAEPFAAYLRAWSDVPTCVPLVAIDREAGRPVGCSSFFDVREAHRGLEIGFTWIGAAWRGTSVNPEMKLLMLAHAFDELGAGRVQLKCDARNAQSRAAILKLGAQFEGVLRQHGITPDGSFRDTAMYSIVDREWPAVRERLRERLGRLSAQ